MRMVDIIEKKKMGQILSHEEIEFVVFGFTKGEIPDYQVSALLMAIYFQGMNKDETVALTMAMAHSGEMFDLSEIKGYKVDKHSTGGVGDKTSLILAPMVAALSVPVAKMSGRGLGHTGGTIDKLESFPGFKTVLSKEQFIHNVNDIKIAIVGQTANLAPADKKLYALRDVTATVDHIALIASSIMSKKIASGADGIVLDVKTGSGAFMKNDEMAFELARVMVEIGNGIGRNTVAMISDMDQPLGFAIGNTLEVIEAIETLKGNGPEDLLEICLQLGSYMILAAHRADDLEEARLLLKGTIQDGSALQKMKEFVLAQGGDVRAVDDYTLMPQSQFVLLVESLKEGTVHHMHTEEIGIATMLLGGGRETKESIIDLGVGYIIHKKTGDRVKKGEALATIYGNDEVKMKVSMDRFIMAYEISEQHLEKPRFIKGIVTKDGIKKM